jgi:Tfp pilus assembly protein PilF
MNLALTLERAGRTDEALSAYTNALEIYSDHIPTLQALTRLQIKSGRTNEKTRSNLEEIALMGQTQQWREWAQLQLVRRMP